ncbi:MAG: PAS domain S-box [Thermotogales bacterium 46_20]|nr:MAG: PAS domain S-box [Thermotogales bacterium 46_20]
MDNIDQSGQSSPNLEELLAFLKPHDHLCLIYESEEEWAEAVVPFMRLGLEQSQKCMYIVDTNTFSRIRTTFLDAGVDLSEYERSGQFSILHERDTYTKEGFFDPDLMIELLISETENALKQGYCALRATSEMTWALREYTGAERLLEYEAKLNRDFFPYYPCVAICQYDRWKFDPEIIKGVVLTHPQLIRGSHVYRNFYYIEPEEYFNHKKSEREIQHWLNNLERERQFHESLRSSEEKYRALAEQSTEMLFLHDLEGRLVEVNRAAEDETGFTKEELLSMNVFDLHANKTSEDTIRYQWQGWSVGESHVLDTEHKKKDGSTMPVEVRAQKVSFAGEDFILALVNDISLRKNVEQATKDSYKKLLAVMDSIDAFIYVADMETYEVLFINKYGQDLFGDIVGQTCWKSLQQGQDGPCSFCTNDRLLDEKGQPTGVYKWEFKCTRNGRWYKLHDSTFRWTDGRLVRIEIATDITEQKRIEEELKASSIRLQLAYEGAQLGIWDHDFRTGRVVRTGKWAEMLGYEPEEIENAVGGWKNLVHPDDLEMVERATEDYVIGKTDDFKFAHRLRCKSGEYKWILNWGRVVSRGEDGKALRAVGVHVDISELREAQEALKESEARWKFALEGAGDGVWDLDVQTGKIYYSRRWKEMLGYRETEIKEEHDEWKALIHPEDRDKVLGEVEKCLTGETVSYQNEHRLRCKDGSYKWILARGKVVSWTDEGEPLRIVGTHTDITDRKHAEEALRESEELFRTLVYNVPGAIFMCANDPDRTMEFISKQIQMITGYPEDDFLNNRVRSYNSIIHPDDRERVFMTVDESVRSGNPYTIEYRVVCADDSVRWVSESGQCVFSREGEVRYLAGVIMDVTEQKVAHDKLREAEERFRLLFENSTASIIIFDKETGGIIDANRTAIESHGLETLEELQKNELWLDSPYSLDEARQWMQKAAEEGPQQFEWFGIKKSGEYFWKDVRLSKIILGSSEGILSVSVDITERKKAEEALQESITQMSRITESAIEALAGAVDLRDPYTAGHQRRVAQLAVRMAERMGMDAERIITLRLAAMIHDAGKIQVPSEILNRPGKLGDLEMSLIREHPKSGWQLFKDIEFGIPLAEIIYQHHERLDGSGYPRGLTEEEILPEAKILAVADVVEAMSSHRPYRQALGIEAALQEIEQNAGILYDKEVVDNCVELFREEGFEFEE